MNSKNWKQVQIQEFNKNWYLKKNRFAFLNRLNIIDRVLNRTFPDMVLDLGTGDGELLIQLISSGRFDNLFFGIDISKSLIQIAVKLAKRNKISQSVHFLIADAENLPFREDIFDLITCTAVLEHVFHRELVVKEMSRVVKQKKLIIITIPNSLYHYVFRLLAFLKLRFKDSVYNPDLTIGKLEFLMVNNRLKPIFKLNFVLPIPNFLTFIEKFLIKFKIKNFHLFLNQLLICKR